MPPAAALPALPGVAPAPPLPAVALLLLKVVLFTVTVPLRLKSAPPRAWPPLPPPPFVPPAPPFPPWALLPENVLLLMVTVPPLLKMAPPKPEPPKRPETAQEKFIREALEAHNEYRSRHSAPPLTHNPELSEVAQRYAQYLASRNTLKHSDCNWNGKRMGENLAMIMDSRLSCYPGRGNN